MKKRVISALTAVTVMAGMLFNTVAFADTVKTASATYMQEKVVYHETFEGSCDSVDFEVDPNYASSYEDRVDGNGKALVYRTVDSKTATQPAYLRFLHNASGEGRKLTLYKYMENADITEISVDIYAPEPRNMSVNIATVGWDWRHSLDISANGYVYYPDWEQANNGRKVNWAEAGLTADTNIQDVAKDKITSIAYTKDYTADFTFGEWHTMKFVYDKSSSIVSTYVDDTLIGRRVQLSTRGKWGLVTIEDETALETGKEVYRVDNFKITQKNLVPVTTETYSESFDGEAAFDVAATTYYNQWWSVPAVEASGDDAHKNILSMKVPSTASRATFINDEQKMRLFEKSAYRINSNGYMNGDISFFEADFKIPEARRMSIEVITTGWAYYPILINSMTKHQEWMAFGGNLANPSDVNSTSYKLQTQNDTKTAIIANGTIPAGNIKSFPVFDNSNWHNNWHKVRFVQDRTNKTLTAYVDGILLGSCDFNAEVLGIGFSSQTAGIEPGETILSVDNLKIGAVSNLKTPSVSIVDKNGSAVNTLTAGETYYAALNGVSNNTTADKNIQLFIASYGQHGNMTDIKCVRYAIPALSELSINSVNAVKLDASADADAVKAFAWSDYDTIIPLCVNDIVE